MQSGVTEMKSGGATALVAALVSATVLALALASQAEAHGIVVEQRTEKAIEIQAAFETGDPMSEGQVAVYAPNEPDEPWRTGLTDSEGRYTFIPDTSRPGEWEVEVRQAGHGETITAQVEGENEPEQASETDSGRDDSGGSEQDTVSSNSAGFGTGQMALMGALGIWGFVGTALFFSRRRS